MVVIGLSLLSTVTFWDLAPALAIAPVLGFALAPAASLSLSLAPALAPEPP